MTDQLDETSWAILEALQQNARISYAELGKRVGLTSPAVAERVRKMEDAGIIDGYHAAVNLAALGLPISVVIQLRLNDTRSKEVVALIRAQPEVTTCYHLTGNDCFMIVASVASIASSRKDAGRPDGLRPNDNLHRPFDPGQTQSDLQPDRPGAGNLAQSQKWRRSDSSNYQHRDILIFFRQQAELAGLLIAQLAGGGQAGGGGFGRGNHLVPISHPRPREAARLVRAEQGSQCG